MRFIECTAAVLAGGSAFYRTIAQKKLPIFFRNGRSCAAGGSRYEAWLPTGGPRRLVDQFRPAVKCGFGLVLSAEHRPRPRVETVLVRLRRRVWKGLANPRAERGRSSAEQFFLGRLAFGVEKRGGRRYRVDIKAKEENEVIGWAGHVSHGTQSGTNQKRRGKC